MPERKLPSPEIASIIHLAFMQGRPITVSMMKDYLKEHKEIKKEENGNKDIQ